MFDEHERHAPEPPDDRVAALLAAAAAPSEYGPVPGESAAVAEFRAANQPTSSRRRRMLSQLTPLKTAAAAMGAGVLLTGGLTAAATGGLPGAAQNTAREMLAHIGVTVPGPAESSAGHADQRGSVEHAAETGEGGDSGRESGARTGKGGAVSELARNTDSTGVDKGAEISDYASQGRSQAGEHGTAEPPARPEPGGRSADHTQVDTPNTSGADRPDNAGRDSGGEHTGGTTHADGGAASPDDAGAARGDEASASGRQTADAAGDGGSSAGSQSGR